MNINKASSGKLYRQAFRTVRRVVFYLLLFRMQRVILFRLSLSDWTPKNVRLFGSNWKSEFITPKLVDSYFATDANRRELFLMYLKTGARGILLTDERDWVAVTWYIDLSLREKGVFGRPRHFTFVGLPDNYKLEKNAYWCFSGEVQSRYEGFGAFLYLINESYRQLVNLVPDAVVYSNVEVANRASWKNKMRIGEVPLGTYHSLYIRFMGWHFSNVYNSRLNRQLIPEDLENMIHRAAKTDSAYKTATEAEKERHMNVTGEATL